MTIHSYPSVYAIGHRAINGIFNDPVVVEEKIDGSQFSFGLIDGVLFCRSKGKVLILDAPEKMFSRAVASVMDIQFIIHPGWVYRCEYLEKPKHNTIAYDRIPAKHLIGFDICPGLEEYLSPEEKRAEFERIGLETVPLLHAGKVEGVGVFNEFLDRVSILGGAKIEGVVVKNYSMFTQEKKVAMGKYVSEAFKELHEGEWRKANPPDKDITQQLIDRYKTPARWNKAIQHLRDRGELDESPRDIGNLMREVGQDVLRECEGEIKDILFEHYWKQIQRGITSGLPEWYKQELAQSAFEING